MTAPSWIATIAKVFHGVTESSRFSVYKSYMDETGIQSNDPYCVIAGYVAEQSAWEKFEHDWKFILSEFDVCYFHSLEFYGNDRYRIYKDWKPGRRLAFINLLFDCIRDAKLVPFASGVDVPIFLSMTEDERHWVTGGQFNGFRWTRPGAPSKPYFAPFHTCIIQSADPVPDGHVVFPIMSRQDQYEMKALELYEIILKSDPPLRCRPKLADEMLFSDPKKVAQLQAADLSAYWWGQAMKQRAKQWDAWNVRTRETQV